MKTSTNHYQFSGKFLRAILILLLAVLGVYSCQVHAQSKVIKYIGLETSFGTRYFSLSSNIQALNKSRLGHEGGSIGLVTGNEVVKTRIRVAGFFCPNANNPRTQELFESAISTNFYPIELFRKHGAVLHPYVMIGSSRTAINYYGTYLSNENWAGKDEPFLGKTIQYNVTGGLGLEMRLENKLSFVHFFVEGIFEKNLSSVVKNQAFNQTTMGKVTSMNFGVSFGKKRFN